jgi:hypothetical protein
MEEMNHYENNVFSLENESIRWGLYLGGISIFSTIVINTTLGVDWPVRHFFSSMLLNLTIMVAILVMAGRSRRTQLGGFMSYRQALVSGILTFVVASILTIIFTSLYNYVIAPESVEIIKNASIEMTEDWMSGANVPQKDIDKTIAQIEKQDFSFSMLSIGKQLGGSLIFGVILSLIISIFTRKERPLFDA